MFQIHKTYNFDIKTELIPLLGASYKQLKVIGILSATEAVKFKDVYTEHTQALSFLADLPSDPKDMTYYVLEDVNHDKQVFSIDYIILSSITEVTTLNIRIDIYDVTTQDLVVIKNILNETGYVNLTISQLEVTKD